jgi:4-amino-4-deoxy-L-arabinose transferase-like glycosyltransferase
MHTDLDSYLVLLMLSATAVLLDGQLIRANGYVYLQAVHGDEDMARSVNRMITALFHLVMLGLAALLAMVDIPMGSPTQVVVTKLGVILLALAAAHAVTMFALSRISARPHERFLREEFTRRAAMTNSVHDHQTEEAPRVRG